MANEGWQGLYMHATAIGARELAPSSCFTLCGCLEIVVLLTPTNLCSRALAVLCLGFLY